MGQKTMQLLMRLMAVLIVAICIVLLPAGQAAAEKRAPDLAATIAADIPQKATLHLENISGSACQVATTAQGTIAVTRVVQGGKVLQPTAGAAAGDEDLGFLLRSQLKTVQPGDSVAIALPVYALQSGLVLRATTYSSDAGAFSAQYAVQAEVPLQIELHYDLPIAPKKGAPACGAVLASTVAKKSPSEYLTVGSAGLVVVLATLGLLRLLRTRRSRKLPAAVAGVVTLLGVCGLLFAPSAQAEVIVPSDMRGAFDACMATLEANRDITGPVLDAVNNPGNAVEIVRTSGGSETTGYRTDTGGNFTIYWNPDDRHAYAGTGGRADPCTSLYHEMYHILDMHNGTFNRDDCGGSGIETKEVMATRAQNALRERLGMPPRSHYGDRALPSGSCTAPADPARCTGEHCGDTNGDPHLRTFDGLRYDFQAVGEFIAARSQSGGYEIQVRQEPWLDSRIVSINTAAAFNIDNDRVEIRAGQAMQLVVNGKVKPLANATLPGGGLLRVDNGVAVLVWPDSSRAYVRPVGQYGLAVSVQPSEELAGKLEGLFGDANGNSDNDLRVSGSGKVVQPVHRQLYPAFADSWRIDDKTSLFTYAAGKRTASYTDRSFPDDMGDPKKLPGYSAAAAYCKSFGISDAAVLANCALDVTLTGRPEFARAASNSQVFAAGAGFGGTAWQLTVKQAGDSVGVTFDATAGEKIFVDIPQTTLSSHCGTLKLLNPDGTQLAGGCIINGSGEIDGTVLPATGTYTISLTPDEPGTASVRLLRITDTHGPITPDGPRVTAKIERPGVVARSTFAGRAGQRIYVDVPASTLPSQCGLLRLVAPDGSTLGSGCIINSSGDIDTTILPQSGQYTVVVDPAGTATGVAQLRLIESTADTKVIIPDSPALAANIPKAGSIAQFTFNGTTGQRIYVDIPTSELPSRCGVLLLRGPDAGTLRSGCIINRQGSLDDNGVILPANGIYTIILDPHGADTGKSTIRLRSR